MVTSRAEPDEWQAVQIIWNVDPDVPVAVNRKGQTQYLPPRADLFVSQLQHQLRGLQWRRSRGGRVAHASANTSAGLLIYESIGMVMMSVVHRRAVHRHGLGYLVNMGVNMHGWTVVSAC